MLSARLKVPFKLKLGPNGIFHLSPVVSGEERTQREGYAISRH